MPPSRIPRSPIHEGARAEARLQSLGVPSSSTVLDALAIGSSAFRSCNQHHPRSYPGTRMWAETFEAMAFSLIPLGWTLERVLNVEMLVNPQASDSIIVTAGDLACGHRDVFPQVKYERGEVISGMINGPTPSFFNVSAAMPPRTRVWFLLHRVRTVMVDAELSSPRGIDAAGLVTGWSERILLPSSPSGQGTRRQTPSAIPPATPNPIHVPVARRGA